MGDVCRFTMPDNLEIRTDFTVLDKLVCWKFLEWLVKGLAQLLGVHRTPEQTADYDPYHRYKTQIETFEAVFVVLLQATQDSGGRCEGSIGHQPRSDPPLARRCNFVSPPDGTLCDATVLVLAPTNSPQLRRATG